MLLFSLYTYSSMIKVWFVIIVTATCGLIFWIAEELRRNNVARFLFGDEETHLKKKNYVERPIFNLKTLVIRLSWRKT